MELDTIYQSISEGLTDVEKHLFELSRAENIAVSEAVFQTLRAGGKRLRPALVLMSAQACGCENGKGTRVAAAMELIHTASLIHDDVIDDADTRRGLPTVNSRCGMRMTVLIGDYVYSRVMGILAVEGNLEILKCATDCAESMIASELTQTAHQNDVNISEETYLSIIAGKTASLLSCACKSGALLGDVQDGEVEILAEYGMNLGMAFQITDDLLDITGTQDTVGKPMGNDIKEGRMTLPYIHTMSSTDDGAAGLIEKAFSPDAPEAIIGEIQGVVESSGGIQYSRERAREYAVACKKGLESLAASESRDAMALLADYVTDRIS
jgi:geranylgeranyl pyrophosphate synthase